MLIRSTGLRIGMCILYNGEPHIVRSIKHLTPGNWRGMVITKLRNLRSGKQAENRFGTDEMVEKVMLLTRQMQYLYDEGDQSVFMDTENYEQVHLNKDVLGEAMQYIVADTPIMIQFHDEKPVGVDLPTTVDLKVVETEPGLKGATASNSPKPAKLETGLIVSVPTFISVGEKIRIDTATGEYVERR